MSRTERGRQGVRGCGSPAEHCTALAGRSNEAVWASVPLRPPLNVTGVPASRTLNCSGSAAATAPFPSPPSCRRAGQGIATAPAQEADAMSPTLWFRSLSRPSSPWPSPPPWPAPRGRRTTSSSACPPPSPGSSRGLGIELYRGSMAWFDEINAKGGVHGHKIVLKAYDDGYNPTPAIENTVKLIEQDHAFVLFDYVGTPTVTRVLPLLKRYESDKVYLFCPFTGAEPMRRRPTTSSFSTFAPPTRMRPAGTGPTLRRHRPEEDRRLLPDRRLRPRRLGRRPRAAAYPDPDRPGRPSASPPRPPTAAAPSSRTR